MFISSTRTGQGGPCMGTAKQLNFRPTPLLLSLFSAKTESLQYIWLKRVVEREESVWCIFQCTCGSIIDSCGLIFFIFGALFMFFRSWVTFNLLFDTYIRYCTLTKPAFNTSTIRTEWLTLISIFNTERRTETSYWNKTKRENQLNNQSFVILLICIGTPGDLIVSNLGWRYLVSVVR